MHFPRALLAAPIVAALALGGVAEAHPRLIGSTPAANAAVAHPSKIVLKFSEKLIGPMTAAEVVMTGMPGKPLHQPVKMAGFKGAVTTDGKTFALVRPKPLPVGTYKVVWHAVSIDTHRVAGAFAFTVK
jgi:methionine-rich copper-binding protein CopC